MASGSANGGRPPSTFHFSVSVIKLLRNTQQHCNTLAIQPVVRCRRACCCGSLTKEKISRCSQLRLQEVQREEKYSDRKQRKKKTS